MIYRDLLGNKVSMLGMGTMRLPVQADGTIDEVKTKEMVDYGMAHGVNYFDTAWPYHLGKSEEVIGRCLKDYPRESYFLADKYPGHAVADSYNPAETFEKQLAKCGVEYFDYYLLHNVYEKSVENYKDPKWGMVDYFREQKRNGRIKHLGFSSHGSIELMEEFLDYCEGDMEFCLIQLNYLDWSLQKGEAKYNMLKERGIPVIVMEPVRGGRLVNLNEAEMAALDQVHPGRSAADWALRFFHDLDNVSTVLSGISSLQQLQENVASFEEAAPLAPAEKAALYEVAEGMKNTVPCTACGYCLEGCPMGLDIPLFLSIYNELKFDKTMTVAMRIEWLPEDKKPSACTACGKCTRICPQHIDIPTHLAEFPQLIEGVPTWADVCRQREEAMKAMEAAEN